MWTINIIIWYNLFVMKKLKKIEIKSASKTIGVVYTLFGLFIGIIFAVMFLFVHRGEYPTGLSLLFSVVFVIVAPIVYGVLGLIFGSAAAWIYNLAAKWTGGIEFETE
jgi:predicted membrane protein